MTRYMKWMDGANGPRDFTVIEDPDGPSCTVWETGTGRLWVDKDEPLPDDQAPEDPDPTKTDFSNTDFRNFRRVMGWD